MTKVWKEDNFVFKRQHEFFTDNEIHFLKLMYHTGYVPYAEQVDRDLLKIEYIPDEDVTDPDEFLSHLENVLHSLQKCNIAHGDLTTYAIRVKDNKPYLIDFSESRFIDDPRPHKRPEGDKYWMTYSMHQLVSSSNAINKRFKSQFQSISWHVSFKNKTVLDLGCGYGDMLLAATHAGASKVTGIDYNEDVLRITKERIEGKGIELVQFDINNIDKYIPIKYDIIVCFSVLPYLDDQNKTLDWISDNCDTALIEVQYENDGPGTIKNDRTCRELLRGYFYSVKDIGKTLVDYRNKYRTIWMCDT